MIMTVANFQSISMLKRAMGFPTHAKDFEDSGDILGAKRESLAGRRDALVEEKSIETHRIHASDNARRLLYYVPLAVEHCREVGLANRARTYYASGCV